MISTIAESNKALVEAFPWELVEWDVTGSARYDEWAAFPADTQPELTIVEKELLDSFDADDFYWQAEDAIAEYVRNL